jgi:predicted transcriptional regulator
LDWIASAVRIAAESGAFSPLMGRSPLTSQEIEGAPVRREILKLVRAKPGIPISEVRARLDLGWGSLYYHIQKLELAGYLEVCSVGRLNLLYPPGADHARHAKAVSFLRGDTAMRIAEAILAEPGCSVPDLIAATGESPRVVYYHVKRLAEIGVVTSASRLRHVELQPTPELEPLLRKIRQDAR